MTQGADNLTSSPGSQGGETPHIGSLKPGPWLAGLLFALLFGSAALAMWIRQFPGRVPQILEATAPWVFLAFVVVFAAYRLALVRAKRYPAFKAFFQIGAAILFFTLLLPAARHPYEAPADQRELLELLAHPDGRVRALAAEVVRYRADARSYAPGLVDALKDSNPDVRREAHQSLVRIHGSDLGQPESEGAFEAWEKQFR